MDSALIFQLLKKFLADSNICFYIDISVCRIVFIRIRTDFPQASAFRLVQADDSL